MPFTFAHPAAVLPLRRRLWSPGPVTGSVAPDLAYHLPVPGGADLTHSVLGVVGVDLLLGLALLARDPRRAGPGPWRPSPVRTRVSWSGSCPPC
ncbi:hypothetical protein GCM10010492_58880 [Saccharothrix mutabilis subsp. mutabilis]|uniref:DUF4184 family protein n=1 Tax=Saccharothrix mutabilis subsp. mutabilis TaxID=66855 RepID=A0ABN0UHL3_9PSEU